MPKLPASDEMYWISQGAGDPVLFLHGIPTSCQLWNGVIERMAGTFTCLAVDLPGLGKTTRTVSGFRDLDSLVAKIEALRIKCKIDKWHVVGHDAGCAIAVHYAHRHQQHVDRLALVTPSIFPDLKPFSLFELLRKPVLGELMAPVVNFVFWKLIMRRALERTGDQVAALADFYEPFRSPLGAWRFMSLLRWGNPAEVLAAIPEELADLLIPTIIFHGLQDRAVPKRFATQTALLLRQSEIVLLDCGHFVPMKEPAAIAVRLLRFFDRQAAIDQRSTTAQTIAAD
jgi:pimeloyl-ACP methyl ester carboxylesterase